MSERSYYDWLREQRSTGTALDSDFDESKVRRAAKGTKGGGRFAKKPETLAKEDQRDVLPKTDPVTASFIEAEKKGPRAVVEAYKKAVGTIPIRSLAKIIRTRRSNVWETVDPDGEDTPEKRLKGDQLSGVYHSLQEDTDWLRGYAMTSSGLRKNLDWTAEWYENLAENRKKYSLGR